jgi:hypothetical protein
MFDTALTHCIFSCHDARQRSIVQGVQATLLHHTLSSRACLACRACPAPAS